MTSFSTFKPSPQNFEMRIVRGRTEAALKKELTKLRKQGWGEADEIKRAAKCEVPNASGEYYCLMARPKPPA